MCKFKRRPILLSLTSYVANSREKKFRDYTKKKIFKGPAADFHKKIQGFHLLDIKVCALALNPLLCRFLTGSSKEDLSLAY